MWHVRLFFPCGLRSSAGGWGWRGECICVSKCDEFQLPASSLGRLPEHQRPSRPYFMLTQEKKEKKKHHTFLPLCGSLNSVVHYTTFVCMSVRVFAE